LTLREEWAESGEEMMQLRTSGMKEDDLSSKENARVLHQLLQAIEAVRNKRQEDYRDRPHPQLKRFTQQELNDEACLTYKNWLIGRSNRLPSRSTLMQIADYLECSFSERNDLLLAAQYLPEQPEWEGNALQQALEHAQQVMETLPYPAIVVTHRFQIQAANELFLRIQELPSFDTLPQHQRTMVHCLLNPNFRERSMRNTEAHAMWQKHVLYGLQHFKQQNALYQYDAWYQQFVKQCCDEIADFREYWAKAQATTRQEVAPTKMVFARMATGGEVIPIRVRHMQISVSNKTYPAVSALLPVDEAARAVYASYSEIAGAQ
jgi:transcriptional regulator with XRE-family HTH domain